MVYRVLRKQLKSNTISKTAIDPDEAQKRAIDRVSGILGSRLDMDDEE